MHMGADNKIRRITTDIKISLKSTAHGEGKILKLHHNRENQKRRKFRTSLTTLFKYFPSECTTLG